MKCIIPCAGESSRMLHIPKHLVQVAGKPLIAHIIDAWKDSVDSFIFILKRNSSYMWEYLPENSAVVFQDEPKGLADAILRAEPYVDGRFMVALGDCIYKGTFEEKAFGLGVGVWKTKDAKEIRKNYLVGISVYNGLINNFTEKPEVELPWGNCGMGIYFLDSRIFSYIRRYEGSRGGGDFTFILKTMIDNGEEIHPVYFHGHYINVGSPEDLEKAEGILSKEVETSEEGKT